jgi:muramoyltetrapeptide carboxypeptidase
MNQGTLQKPPALRQGDAIGIIATGSPLSAERFRAGVQALEGRGFKVVSPFDPTEYYGRADFGFASQSAAVRTAAFAQLAADPEVKAIIAVRGAYGTLDVLPAIDYKMISAAPKLLVGMSDITVLLVQYPERAAVPSIHGATIGSAFADAGGDSAAAESVDILLRTLTDPAFRLTADVRMLRAGRGEGRILAGNLTMLLSLLGTPWDIDYSDALLVIEDVGEAPYRIHRAFTQLKLAGKLDALQGLIFGRFARCEAKNGPTVDDVFQCIVRDILRGSDFPVAEGLDAGHWGRNLPLPLGCRAVLADGKFDVLEAPVR